VSPSDAIENVSFTREGLSKIGELNSEKLRHLHEPMLTDEIGWGLVWEWISLLAAQNPRLL